MKQYYAIPMWGKRNRWVILCASLPCAYGEGVVVKHNVPLTALASELARFSGTHTYD